MKSYLDIITNVLVDGEMKGNRTGTRAITTFGETFRHDMRDGFPLLTTKKVAWKTMAVELEGFIKGITDKEWYQERRCKIWNEWANPEAVDKMPTEEAFINPISGFWDEKPISREENQKKCADLGPIYGYQWRNFNKEYTFKGARYHVDYGITDFPNGMPYAVDQLGNAIETLKNNPDDRRMVVSAWNPNQMHMMALPPCHYAFNLVHINGKLNLQWTQRSCDLMLGVPFNIASYALLLKLICLETGLEPRSLKGDLNDCHIYENHLDAAHEQRTREPGPLPAVKINTTDFSIWNWTHENLDFVDYDPHKPIKMEVAV